MLSALSPRHRKATPSKAPGITASSRFASPAKRVSELRSKFERGNGSSPTKIGTSSPTLASMQRKLGKVQTQAVRSDRNQPSFGINVLPSFAVHTVADQAPIQVDKACSVVASPAVRPASNAFVRLDQARRIVDELNEYLRCWLWKRFLFMSAEFHQKVAGFQLHPRHLEALASNGSKVAPTEHDAVVTITKFHSQVKFNIEKANTEHDLNANKMVDAVFDPVIEFGQELIQAFTNLGTIAARRQPVLSELLATKNDGLEKVMRAISVKEAVQLKMLNAKGQIELLTITTVGNMDEIGGMRVKELVKRLADFDSTNPKAAQAETVVLELSEAMNAAQARVEDCMVLEDFIEHAVVMDHADQKSINEDQTAELRQKLSDGQVNCVLHGSIVDEAEFENNAEGSTAYKKFEATLVLMENSTAVLGVKDDKRNHRIRIVACSNTPAGIFHAPDPTNPQRLWIATVAKSPRVVCWEASNPLTTVAKLTNALVANMEKYFASLGKHASVAQARRNIWSTSFDSNNVFQITKNLVSVTRQSKEEAEALCKATTERALEELELQRSEKGQLQKEKKTTKNAVMTPGKRFRKAMHHLYKKGGANSPSSSVKKRTVKRTPGAARILSPTKMSPRLRNATSSPVLRALGYASPQPIRAAASRIMSAQELGSPTLLRSPKDYPTLTSCSVPYREFQQNPQDKPVQQRQRRSRVANVALRQNSMAHSKPNQGEGQAIDNTAGTLEVCEDVDVQVDESQHARPTSRRAGREPPTSRPLRSAAAASPTSSSTPTTGGQKRRALGESTNTFYASPAKSSPLKKARASDSTLSQTSSPTFTRLIGCILVDGDSNSRDSMTDPPVVERRFPHGPDVDVMDLPNSPRPCAVAIPHTPTRTAIDLP